MPAAHVIDIQLYVYDAGFFNFLTNHHHVYPFSEA